MSHCARRLLAASFALGIFAALTPWAWSQEGEASKRSAPLAARLTTSELDLLIAAQSPPAAQSGLATDEAFLRRASFDLIGRPPTPEEQQQFSRDVSPQKHHDLIERLLASDEFGANWADYWADTIAFHVPPPELTYLDYSPLKKWLAERLNENAPWDKVVRELLMAKGKIAEVPAATFVGYHQAKATNLAAETSRIFLGQQIGCAECHDHPFDAWKRTQFHELAAFFVRAKAKLPWNDGPATVVSSADKGEYLMPDMADPRHQGSQIVPAFLDGKAAPGGQADDERRSQLADWITARENPWFVCAYANRIWARLMGRGFCEPVDDLGDSRGRTWPAVHEAVSGHFAATGFDVKDLFRLVMNSDAYRRGIRMPAASDGPAVPESDVPLRLRGDEVFASLRQGIELADKRPSATAPTAAVRFPPPPKSTRDLVNEAFATDPSLPSIDAPRTIGQALWMMNNEQLQKEINAAPDSGTMLAKLLAETTDDRAVCEQLFARVLARSATADELRIALAHVAKVGDRRAAFEDLLWSLVNTAEFTTRR